MTRAKQRAIALLLVGVVPALLGLAACSDEGGSPEELCEALADRDFATVFTGFDPADPVTALDQLRTARVNLSDLHEAAPAEQRTDLQLEIAYVQALIDAIEPLGDAADVAVVAAALQQVTTEHPDVDEAAVRLAAFQQSSC